MDNAISDRRYGWLCSIETAPIHGVYSPSFHCLKIKWQKNIQIHSKSSIQYDLLMDFFYFYSSKILKID